MKLEDFIPVFRYRALCRCVEVVVVVGLLSLSLLLDRKNAIDNDTFLLLSEAHLKEMV